MKLINFIITYNGDKIYDIIVFGFVCVFIFVSEHDIDTEKLLRKCIDRYYKLLGLIHFIPIY